MKEQVIGCMDESKIFSILLWGLKTSCQVTVLLTFSFIDSMRSFLFLNIFGSVGQKFNVTVKNKLVLWDEQIESG